MDVAGSGSCSVAIYGIMSSGFSGSAARELAVHFAGLYSYHLFINILMTFMFCSKWICSLFTFLFSYDEVFFVKDIKSLRNALFKILSLKLCSAFPTREPTQLRNLLCLLK